jgi:methylmalonyl-CoA mutase N-terminal domain/subunit
MLRTHCQTSGWSADRAGPVQQRRAHHASRRWRRCSAARRACTPTRFDEAHRPAHRVHRRASPATPSCILQEETHITQRGRPLGRHATMMETLTHAHGRRGLGASSRRSKAHGRHDARPSRRGWAKLRIEASGRTKPGAHRLRRRTSSWASTSTSSRREDAGGDPRDRQRRGARRRRSRACSACGPPATPPRVRRGAGRRSPTARASPASGNLLALAIEAHAPRATVGEMSRRAGSRSLAATRPTSSTVTGVYGSGLRQRRGTGTKLQGRDRRASRRRTAAGRA